MKFDDLDIKILFYLTKDSRISFRKIAEEIAHNNDEYKNINSSTVFRRFKRLKKYLSFNTRFDKDLIYHFNLIGVVVNIDDIIKVISDYKKCPRVVEMYRLSGKFNLLFKGIFENPMIFSSFIDELRSDPRIKSVELCVNCQQVAPEPIAIKEVFDGNSNVEIAPCGRNCGECTDYKDACPGCPATKWYCKTIFPIKENVVKNWTRNQK